MIPSDDSTSQKEALERAVEPSPPAQFRFPGWGETIWYNDNRYIIGKPLGYGAFGAVYECVDDWGNELAAKVLHPLGDRNYDHVRTEWLGELQRLVLLRHPNITFIYDAFEYNETFYIVMERCAYTLRHIIDLENVGGDIWVPYVARDILQALDFIHKAGYVHKDIHPGNVFVAQTLDRMVPTKARVWSFKIGDLGISNLETDINVFNTILAQWMLPPEYLNPEFGPIGRAVDIYHTALLLLSLLLGQSPDFTRDQILDGVPRKVAESLSSPFAPAISKALRRHVAHRTHSALDFWRDISDAVRIQEQQLSLGSLDPPSQLAPLAPPPPEA
jgi:serine/threonine protein kinase